MTNQIPKEWLQWLYKVLQPEYKDPQFTYQDVAIALQSFPSLKMRTKVHTSEYGVSELLLSVYGTVPSTFNNTIYRIPVEIWIPKQYPEIPPIIYVTPTNEMMLQPGNFVDSSGKFYNPYLSNWSSTNPSSNLVKLVSLLSECFSKEPPVFGRSNKQQHQQQHVRTVSGQYQSMNHQSPPPLPAKPCREIISNSTGNISMPSPSPSSGILPNHTGFDGVAASSQTIGISSNNAAYKAASIASFSSLSPSSTTRGTPVPPPLPEIPDPLKQSHPHLYQQQQQQQQQLLQLLLQAAYNSNQQIAQPSPTGPPNPTVVDLMDNDTITATSTGSDAALADKTKLQLTDALITTSKNTLEPFLVSQDAKLNQINHSIGQFENILQYEKTVLRNYMNDISVNEQTLLLKIAQVQEVIDAAQRFKTDPKNNMDVDEIVCAETVAFNQLYQLVAEIKAVDDTVYCLTQLFEKGKVSLEVFMKHTRALARDQFKKKALVKKISEML